MMPDFGQIQIQRSMSLYACWQAPKAKVTSWVPVQVVIDAMGDHDQWNCKECSPARCDARSASISEIRIYSSPPPLPWVAFVSDEHFFAHINFSLQAAPRGSQQAVG